MRGRRAARTARWRRGGAAALAIGLALAVTGTAAWSSAASPRPGTAAQVAALVAKSHAINKLSATVSADLEASIRDTPVRVYPKLGSAAHTSDCTTLTRCVFGDTKSKRVIVLYGDSHAFMWIPALATVGTDLKMKVILLWWPACPVAYLTAYKYEGAIDQTGCASWRTTTVAAIKKIKPALVLLGERTAAVLSEPSGQPFTATAWQEALVPAITQFQTKATKVAVIEDIPYFDVPSPQSCMAQHPSAIQECGMPYPNPKYPGQQAAEAAAATETGAGFITTVPWFCTTTCSPVVGSFIVHYDESHVSATYAQYLTTVMLQAVKALP